MAPKKRAPTRYGRKARPKRNLHVGGKGQGLPTTMLGSKQIEENDVDNSGTEDVDSFADPQVGADEEESDKNEITPRKRLPGRPQTSGKKLPGSSPQTAGKRLPGTPSNRPETAGKKLPGTPGDKRPPPGYGPPRNNNDNLSASKLSDVRPSAGYVNQLLPDLSNLKLGARKGIEKKVEKPAELPKLPVRATRSMSMAARRKDEPVQVLSKPIQAPANPAQARRKPFQSRTQVPSRPSQVPRKRTLAMAASPEIDEDDDDEEQVAQPVKIKKKPGPKPKPKFNTARVAAIARVIEPKPKRQRTKAQRGGVTTVKPRPSQREAPAAPDNQPVPGQLASLPFVVADEDPEVLSDDVPFFLSEEDDDEVLDNIGGPMALLGWPNAMDEEFRGVQNFGAQNFGAQANRGVRATKPREPGTTPPLPIVRRNLMEASENQVTGAAGATEATGAIEDIPNNPFAVFEGFPRFPRFPRSGLEDVDPFFGVPFPLPEEVAHAREHGVNPAFISGRPPPPNFPPGYFTVERMVEVAQEMRDQDEMVRIRNEMREMQVKMRKELEEREAREARGEEPEFPPYEMKRIPDDAAIWKEWAKDMAKNTTYPQQLVWERTSGVLRNSGGEEILIDEEMLAEPQPGPPAFKGDEEIVNPPKEKEPAEPILEEYTGQFSEMPDPKDDEDAFWNQWINEESW
ncbi:MAG: hypothetical protein M1829_002734 [Trizodia sp. TS-e1964]|nr:MAG: hypothetical protein M1829_002734 [Trizodia sp. TS-e1964]